MLLFRHPNSPSGYTAAPALITSFTGGAPSCHVNLGGISVTNESSFRVAGSRMAFPWHQNRRSCQRLPWSERASASHLRTDVYYNKSIIFWNDPLASVWIGVCWFRSTKSDLRSKRSCRPPPATRPSVTSPPAECAQCRREQKSDPYRAKSKKESMIPCRGRGPFTSWICEMFFRASLTL